MENESDTSDNSSERHAFPTVLIGEWTPILVDRPFGLFAYRVGQAMALLRVSATHSDTAVSYEERQRINDEFLPLCRPLTALGLFLGVAALEDFGRDLMEKLTEDEFLRHHFPKVCEWNSRKGFRSLYPKKWNEKYQEIFSIQPISIADFPHLNDLRHLRNAVAHHGSLIPGRDVEKFKYWDLKAGQQVNPPAKFVRDELLYIFRIGKSIHDELTQVVLKHAIEVAGRGWSTEPSADILRLIEVFTFFGFLESDEGLAAAPASDWGFKEEVGLSQRVQEKTSENLHLRCIDCLIEKFGA